MTKVPAIACSGHVTSPAEEVRSCVECGHPTDRGCIVCALFRSRKDPRRSEMAVDALALAESAMDRSGLCPCCQEAHLHIADPWAEPEARAS